MSLQPEDAVSSRDCIGTRQNGQLEPEHEDLIKHQLSGLPYFNIRDLPTEIRVQVFEMYFVDIYLACYERHMLGDWWATKTPSLVQALRGEPKLYFEALEAYYSNLPATVSPDNAEAVARMPKSVVRRARDLRIYYGHMLVSGEWKWSVKSSLPDLSILTNSNIRSLHLSTDENLWRFEGRPRISDLRLVENIVREFVLTLPRLSLLRLEIPAEAAFPVVFRGEKFECLEAPLLNINKALDVSHEWVRSSRKTKGPRPLEVAWHAGNRPFRWTDKDNIQSVPRAHRGTFLRVVLHSHTMSWRISRCTTFMGLNPKPHIRYCVNQTCVCSDMVASASRVPDHAEAQSLSSDWLQLTPWKTPVGLSLEQKAALFKTLCVPPDIIAALY
ncbi:uncharacterized protein L3040_000903 [Drepanopeziza brunnea f. sp. 'multigermtubi']|uniref:Uncharacterized protein n=1 Tax=Marssonina brunnea f. sp. multigermtubi (strain MB_m1) TaxID=1072389 RepID=K1X6T6_MARBU|nr:uncharacterized protein MBM_01478 [Drepanopeziza brunnea f. sp. 'multigermtubi' MB_m1]EKD20796.1 hypothetical protein MBM_01478 [Drepanopeziza brunnea f. sp. 'multigermtubi' MB_m1]KAJ5054636.1 hypothetical protein L3040_000903 [Drepanopeziza brunnea f. sp. 'multigermtubi']